MILIFVLSLISSSPFEPFFLHFGGRSAHRSRKFHDPYELGFSFSLLIIFFPFGIASDWDSGWKDGWTWELELCLKIVFPL